MFRHVVLALFAVVVVSSAALAEDKPSAKRAKKDAPVAKGACAEDKDLTAAFASTNETCKSSIKAGIVGGMSATQCSNISDGLRANCQDGNAAKIAAAIKIVCCHLDPNAKKVRVQHKGTQLDVYFNIDKVSDPADGVRCNVAKALGLKKPTDGMNCAKYE